MGGEHYCLQDEQAEKYTGYGVDGHYLVRHTENERSFIETVDCSDSYVDYNRSLFGSLALAKLFCGALSRVGIALAEALCNGDEFIAITGNGQITTNYVGQGLNDLLRVFTNNASRRIHFF